MIDIKLIDNFYEAEFMTLCHQLGDVFYWWGGSAVHVYRFDGTYTIELETKPVIFEVKRTIKKYIMEQLGIDPNDPPERLW